MWNCFSYFFFIRSNVCTGAVNRDSGSGFINGEYVLADNIVHDANIGSPCVGDQGTSLMVMENDRFSDTIQIQEGFSDNAMSQNIFFCKPLLQVCIQFSLKYLL